MSALTSTVIAFLFFFTAVLYSSIGNAGATGYLAIMALFGLPAEEMRPTALVLNILVATIAAVKFHRAGFFSWRTFWPFALTSIPFAYLGGMIVLPETIYKPIISLVLLYAAFRILRLPQTNDTRVIVRTLPPGVALATGAGIGFLAGLTGVGGGIFLTPLLLLSGWSEARQAAAVSAAFNLVNSIGGLFGQIMITTSLPKAIPIWALAAGLGGWIGSEYGSRRLASRNLQHIVATILVIAALRIWFF